MLDGVSWFFDLYAQDRKPPEAGEQRGGEGEDEEDESLATWKQIAVYVASVIGILIGPYARAAASEKYPTFTEMFGSPMRLFWAIVFGFIVTAFLFKTILSAKNYLIVQIAFALAAGFGSQTIVPKAIDFLAKLVNGA